MSSDVSRKPNHGFWPNLIFNIVIPTFILTKGSGDDWLGPTLGVVVALAFPVCYGLWDLKAAGKVNGFSVLGIVSVLLTGGISLLKLPAEYIAIKEAAIPALIGIAVLLTVNTRFSLVRLIILNDEVLDVERLQQLIEQRGEQRNFNRHLAVANKIVAASFFLSATLNYALARYIVTSPAGTTEYNEQLGTMTAMSYPVIVLPSMIVLGTAIWYLFRQIKKATGHSLEDFVRQ
ncbi:MFS transporter [Bacterioplanes sanyensis]|uniref:VC0807 family protein n=1 Tax=Bacterioplanes sanyensis TaxID=1249553 RepID=UPI00167AAFE5|nr:VC0807 family protein [Bacterioplanes sanyensis]GGY37163.1 MFS transporter [Bacterioplanes sanyensis]